MIDGRWYTPPDARPSCPSTRRARRRSSACAPRTEPAPLGAFLRSGTRRRAAPSRRSSSTPRARASRSTGRRGRSTPSTTTRASCRNTRACARSSSARSPGPSACSFALPSRAFCRACLAVARSPTTYASDVLRLCHLVDWKRNPLARGPSSEGRHREHTKAHLQAVGFPHARLRRCVCKRFLRL